jgi:hypothetical protein
LEPAESKVEDFKILILDAGINQGHQKYSGDSETAIGEYEKDVCVG